MSYQYMTVQNVCTISEIHIGHATRRQLRKYALCLLTGISNSTPSNYTSVLVTEYLVQKLAPRSSGITPEELDRLEELVQSKLDPSTWGALRAFVTWLGTNTLRPFFVERNDSHCLFVYDDEYSRDAGFPCDIENSLPL